jgi:hypothetical protein
MLGLGSEPLIILISFFSDSYSEPQWLYPTPPPPRGGEQKNLVKGLFTQTVILTVLDATAASKDRNNPIFVRCRMRRCRMRLSHPTLSKSLSV